MTWRIKARHPLGISRVSDDGLYEIFSSKPGTGHLTRYPGDPFRHIVYRVFADETCEEGGYVKHLDSFKTLGWAKRYVDLHKEGKVQ